MLHPDQQGVGERSGPEPCCERERASPVLPGDELFDRAGQVLVQLVELRLPLLAGLVPRCHLLWPPPGVDHAPQQGPLCTNEVHQENQQMSRRSANSYKIGRSAVRRTCGAPDVDIPAYLEDGVS